jgi:uncharacterized protein with HEPN domain
MTRDVTIYLSDMITSMDDAGSFIGEMSFEEFSSDKKTINAVIRSIEIIGEAAKKIPEEIRGLQPEIPWKDMAGMRDKCIHFYFGIDMRLLWLTVKNDILKIRPLIQDLLDKLQNNQAGS